MTHSESAIDFVRRMMTHSESAIYTVFVRVGLGMGMFEPLEVPWPLTHIALAARFEFPLRLRVVAGL